MVRTKTKIWLVSQRISRPKDEGIISHDLTLCLGHKTALWVRQYKIDDLPKSTAPYDSCTVARIAGRMMVSGVGLRESCVVGVAWPFVTNIHRFVWKEPRWMFKILFTV